MNNETKNRPEWTMSDERAFIENLICQRFNFFLVFFSIVFAGAISSIDFKGKDTNLILSAAILLIGGMICWLMKSVLARTQEKLDIILDKELPVDHPKNIVDRKARQNASRRRFIGELIPTICCAILTVAFFGAVIVQIILWK